MASSRLCSIPDCSKPCYGHGWCHLHYRRWKRHGDPLGGRTPRGEPMRYFRKVVLAYTGGDCLIWPYALNNGGYGVLYSGGRMKIVSRLACEIVNGPPPTPEHHAAHDCGRGQLGCVTPTHLFWKTAKENVADKIIHGTTNRGERCGSSKLSASDVEEIHRLKGTMSQQSIAARFGVNQSSISDIYRATSWSFLSFTSTSEQRQC